ncbi:unnamed protein product [Taenia asiatica]|uniref:Heat shock protein 70 n=1 Tax=Taenia asiatica TaxID=60517 RepID=A0A0R3WDC9_TAEAS|nr:unnamed protein product [Taenia asiatica]
MPLGPAIGIDLGTTFSCVGIFRNGKVEIIANGQGDRKTPSYVAFKDKELLIGDAAKNQAAMNPTNTVYDVKRLIGRHFIDKEVQSDVENLPFKVTYSNGKPKVEVRYCGKTKQFTVEEISSMVLLEMKKTPETYLGEKVVNAVITVPAYFNDSQRKATIDAGKIAGLNVMRIINEPTAAALAYGLSRRLDRQSNVLIFDLGGGTLDVSIIFIRNKKFEVKAVCSDTHLGGGDLDSRLVNFCVKKFKQEHEGIDLTSNVKAISRLRKACENAKRTLSLLEHTSIDVESLYGDIDFSVSISRHQFEQLCSDLFDRMLAIVNQTLSDAGLDKADVHEVLLVGGSTRVLRVQHLLQYAFSGSKFIKSINPDEAAACGATLLASDAIGEQSLMIREVAPLSLNLEMAGNAIKTLVERNMKIPTMKTENFTTILDNQPGILLRMYGGGYALTNDIKLLGVFHVLGIQPSPPGIPRIKVTFAIDENGILNVSAIDVSSREQNNVYVEELGRLSEKEIEQVVNESRNLKLEDGKQRSKMAVRNKLEDYIFTIKLETGNDEIRQNTSEEQRKGILRLCETTLKWMDSDQQATKEDYDRMLEKVESACSPIMSAKKLDS